MVYLYHCLDVTYGFDHLPWNGFWHSFNVPRTFLALLPLTYGSAGVAVLFVISGFCIHLSHVRARETGYRAFFFRRFFRIYPPYLCALLLFALVPPWRSMNFGSGSRFEDLCTHLALVSNFDLKTFWGINPVLWSVAVEAQLYALYPILLWVAKRWGWRNAMWVCGAFELGHRVAFFGIDLAGGNAVTALLIGSPLSYWLSWAFGAWLAEAHLKAQRLPFSTQPLLLWLLVAIDSALFRPTTAFTFLLFSVVTAIILARVLAGQLAFPKTDWSRLVSSHLKFAGVVSYSLYLIHYPLIELIPQLLRKHIPNTTVLQMLIFTLCLVAWPALLGASYLVNKWVEQTSIRIGKTFARPPVAHRMFRFSPLQS